MESTTLGTTGNYFFFKKSIFATKMIYFNKRPKKNENGNQLGFI